MSLFVPPRPAEPVKAGPIGVGAGPLQTEFLLPMVLPIDHAQRMAQAVRTGTEVAYIRGAERTISGKFSGVDWHLEDPDGETIDGEYKDKRAAAAYTLLCTPMANVPPGTVGQRLSRRQLWGVTSRHMGLAGNAFWFMDAQDGFGIPQSILYIRPDRLTPRFADNTGTTLAYWLLDRRPGFEGTRLELSEVRQFVLEAPNEGVFAPGLVESALTKALLNGAIDRHFTTTLAGGGRLAGIIAPKSNAIEDDATALQVMRDWRNVTEQPESAKRLQIVRAPIDFIRTAATAQEMALIDLMTRNRDDLLALWGVPLSQIGGVTAAGLNSGDVRKYDEAALWQGPVHDRLSEFGEQVQSILDCWKADIGWAPKLVIDEPEFDDDSPRYDKVQKAQFIALTNDERRDLIGFEPLDEKVLGPTGNPIGTEVWMPLTLMPVGKPPMPPADVMPKRVLAPAWSSESALIQQPPSPSMVAQGEAPTSVAATPAAPQRGGYVRPVKAKTLLVKDDPRVNYRPATGVERCSACRFMLPDSKCALVAGVILPDDTCDLFTPAGRGKAKVEDDQSVVVPAVLAGLKKQWPESELDIVKQGTWTYDPSFPLKKVNAARRPVPRNPKIVQDVEAEVQVGAPLRPITIIHTKVIGKPGYTPIDGWHHTLGYEHAGVKKAPAYIGEGDADWTTELLKFNDEIPTPPDSPSEATGKADLAGYQRSLQALRSNVQARMTPQLQDSVSRVLDAQRQDIVARVRSYYDQIRAKPKDTSVWWPPSNSWDSALTAALQPALAGVTQSVHAHIGETVMAGRKAGVVDVLTSVLARVLHRGAARVSGINETTRTGIAEIVADGVSKGLSMTQLADEIESWSGFDEYRAEMIARTETGDAYNSAALASYGEYGVEQVQVLDGDDDDICAPWANWTGPIDEAPEPLGHPNCTRDFLPVI